MNRPSIETFQAGAFYSGFYESILGDESVRKDEAQIRAALEQSRKSAFTLYVKRQRLDK